MSAVAGACSKRAATALISNQGEGNCKRLNQLPAGQGNKSLDFMEIFPLLTAWAVRCILPEIRWGAFLKAERRKPTHRT